ncbi:MAG: hypothetical protein ACR2IL_00485 [Chitinophagaceae bacterium]
MKKKPTEITRLEDHLDDQYGKRGTEKRDKFEEGFEAFLLGVDSDDDGKSFDFGETHEL